MWKFDNGVLVECAMISYFLTLCKFCYNEFILMIPLRFSRHAEQVYSRKI